MKIRSGFVSNSSSASYYVTININLHTFIECMLDELQTSYFSVGNLLEELTKRLELELEEYASYEQPENKVLPLFKEQKLRNIDRLKSKIENLEKIKCLDQWNWPSTENDEKEGKFVVDKVKAVTYILNDIYSIFLIEVNDTVDNCIEISANTSMHNSYNDVPDIMKTIITYFCFNRPDLRKHFRIETENI